MLETVLSSATAASAVSAVALSAYVLRLQLRDRQEARSASERESALRISCWADWSKDELRVMSGAVLRDPVICVANQTDEPVFAAFVDYRDQIDGHPIRLDVGTVPPRSTKTVDVVVPSSERERGWRPEYLLPVLYFRDTRNQWWHRNTVGYLKPDPGIRKDG